MHNVPRIFIFATESLRIQRRTIPRGGSSTDAAIKPANERYHGVDSCESNILIPPRRSGNSSPQITLIPQIEKDMKL
jgi:hypothetical protein